jgi:DNA-binding response OmpR family regulator
LPDLAIVDIVLPGMDGFALAAELQGRGDVPILFLSALSDTATKVEGLERFAEDYVTKPFTFAELAVRIRRILLRSGRTDVLAADVVIDPRLSVNFAQHYAVLDGRRVKLTGIESKLLYLFYEQRGRVLSPGMLLARVWHPVNQGTLRSLWVHIRRLRTKIEPMPQQPCFIVTVRGRGYYLPTPEEKTTSKRWE